MKLDIQNLGYIKKATIELGDFTIIAGKNNTGKTYLSYIIFTYLDKIFSNIRVSEKDISANGELVLNEDFFKKQIESSTTRFSGKITEFFAVREDFFKDINLKIFIEPRTIFSFLKAKISESVQSIDNKKSSFTIIPRINQNEIILTFVLNEGQSTDFYKPFPFGQKFAQTLYFSNYISQELRGYIEPFAITSERTGISLFYKELDFTKNAIVDLMSQEISKQKEKKISNTYEMLNFLEKSLAKYAHPIKSNITIMRSLSDINKQISFIKKNPTLFSPILKIWKEMVGGSYIIKEDDIFFKYGNTISPLHISSSAAKSLLLLDIFIQKTAQKNSILIIDEPELNLHPEAQRMIARLLVQLVNIGIKVVITTHSDFIIREINNLIMLASIKNETKRQNIQKKLKYEPSEFLHNNKIKAYVTENNTLIPVEINKHGLNLKTFDCFINKSNEIANTIVDTLEEDL